MPNRSKARRSWAGLVLLSFVSVACSSPTNQTLLGVEHSEAAGTLEPVDHSEPTDDTEPVDPVSTAFQSAPGAASILPADWPELADSAIAVLEIRVVDVHPSYLNTADGLFPSPADAIDASGNYRFAGLYTLTDIDVEIVSVLATVGDVSEFMNSKNAMTITVHGGFMETVLDVEAARAFGVTQVVEDSPYHEGPEEGVEPDIETEIPAQSPVVMSWGISPSEVLTEGDHLVIFFEVREVNGFSGAPILRRIFPVHPFAVFRSVGGKWVADYPEFTRAFDLDEMVSRVNQRTPSLLGHWSRPGVTAASLT